MTCGPRRKRSSPPSGSRTTSPPTPPAGSSPAAGRAASRCAGYLEEEGIPADSKTETFAAIRVDINTRRWSGVPFYLRTGKRLGRRVTEIAVVFKRAPNLLFGDHESEDDFGQNAVVIRVQPDEGATIRFGSKVPGTQMEVRDVTMDFGYGHSFTESSPEAYERLILDVLLGEPPLFPRHEEVELSWKILDPFEDYWASLDEQPRPYAARQLGAGLGRRDACPRRHWRSREPRRHGPMDAAVIVDLPLDHLQDVQEAHRPARAGRRDRARAGC